MCFFLFVSVRKAQRALLEQLGADDLGVAHAENPTLLDVFPDGHAIVEITHGGCSCDLFQTRSSTELEERERQAYKRKGWSQTKIDRAIRAKRKSGSLAERGFHRSFHARILELLSSVDEVCLYAHWFRGSVNEEKLSRIEEIRVTRTEYENRKGIFPEDALLRVRGEAERRADLA